MAHKKHRTGLVAAVGMVGLLMPTACDSSSSGGPAPAGPPTSSPPLATDTPSVITSPTPARMPSGPACIRPENGTGCLPVAPSADRVDLTRPSFRSPTSITNPLHPSGTLTQVIYGGQVDGEPFRTEFTRLAGLKRIDWQGMRIDAVVWQYLAFSGGRIHEVALDWFAQADDGSVWYLGENVYNYADGQVENTDGTWVTGSRVAPPAMIMPAAPRAAMVYRPENAPGVVFEEVRVLAADRTVTGPSGPVRGAIVVRELHYDGSTEDKTFAPGYGEFSTGQPGADLEAVSLAVPTDARPGAVPAGLQRLAHAVRSGYAALAGGGPAARTAHRELCAAWRAQRPGRSLLDTQMSRDVAALGRAIAAADSGATRDAALRVAQNELDLRMRYQSLPTIERNRFGLWLRQVAVDAKADDHAAVAGDVASLSWTWHRVRPTVDPAVAGRVEARLAAAQAAAARQQPAAAAAIAATIRLN
ncbi:hypothetical protein ACIBL3_34000 [Kribbella sp. NPDC050124]|uniref:hypothetical protein n=1 Tax=Kribbella sp. NPDC050124 TaxID=3364114 RepID=UPI0037A13C01